MAVAEAAVADDPLGGFLALLEVATGLARRHSALRVWREVVEERKRRVEGDRRWRVLDHWCDDDSG